MNTRELLSDITRFVENMFVVYNNPKLLYHNLNHTQSVVKHASTIATYYNLQPSDKFIIISAAWFHDIGHLFGDIAGHEERSVDIMKHYFEDKNVDQQFLQQVEGCILATRLPTNPSTLLQEIICDADTFHLGTKEFLKTDPLIYHELELRLGCSITGRIQKSINFLEMHHFYTDYCLKTLSEGKNKNKAYLVKALTYEDLSCRR